MKGFVEASTTDDTKHMWAMCDRTRERGVVCVLSTLSLSSLLCVCVCVKKNAVEKKIPREIVYFCSRNVGVSFEYLVSP
jgi:hypothetical protein